MSRKRAWNRDEVVLALELYLRAGVVGLAACRDLSEELRQFPIEEHLAVDPSFRNPQAVRSKLYNLQWLDTGGAQGRPNGGAATRQIWESLGQDPDEIKRTAREIRVAVTDARSRTDAGDDEYEADESSVKVVAHRRRERDRDLVVRKRRQVKRRTGRLACEACGFDSDEEWGIEGIIECHHLTPVSELEPGQRTRLSDVRLVCPNCHRLVHSRRRWLAWDQLLRVVEDGGVS